MLTYLVEIVFHITPGCIAGNTFKYEVKIGEAGKTSLISHYRNAFVLIAGEFFAGLIDARLVQKGDKGLTGVLFKITAKCLGGHTGFAGHIIKGECTAIMLEYIVVNIAYPDA